MRASEKEKKKNSDSIPIPLVGDSIETLINDDRGGGRRRSLIRQGDIEKEKCHSDDAFFFDGKWENVFGESSQRRGGVGRGEFNQSF
jgi:hypothetical protein